MTTLVTSFEEGAYIVTENGEEIPAYEGMEILPGDTIVGIIITEEVLDTESEEGADVAALQAAILAGADPTQIAEATAAGAPAAGGEGPTDGGGSSFVALSRTGSEVNATAGYVTGTFGSVRSEAPEGPAAPQAFFSEEISFSEPPVVVEPPANEPPPVEPPPVEPPPVEPPVEDDKGSWQIDQTKAAGDQFSTFDISEGESDSFNVSLGGAGNAKLAVGEFETIRLAVVGGDAILDTDYTLNVEGSTGIFAEIIETGSDYIIVKMTATSEEVNLTGLGFKVTIDALTDELFESTENVKLEIQDPSYGDIRVDKDDIGYNILDVTDSEPPVDEPPVNEESDKQNPGNDKEVGGSPFDGIKGASNDDESPLDSKDILDEGESLDDILPKVKEDNPNKDKNNGWGDGDQDAPGNSGDVNQGENNLNDLLSPTEQFYVDN